MEKDFEQLLETLSNLEAEEDWENLIYNFIDYNCELDSEQAENLSPKAFQDQLKLKTKDVVRSFIKKYIKRLREYKAITDLQNDGIVKLKSEILTFQEENEQLNEMSLTLILQIKRLKKYAGESDILVSILRGEIHKQRRQNKKLMNALEQLYQGNEDLATKILAEPIEEDGGQRRIGSPGDRVGTSPGYRQMSLADDSMLSGLRRSMGFKGTASERGNRGLSTVDMDRFDTIERAFTSEYASSPGEKQIVVNEDDEYIQEFNVESEHDINIELANCRDDAYQISERNDSLSLAQSYIEFLSPTKLKSPRRARAIVPKLLSLLDAEADQEEESFRRTVNLVTSELQSPRGMKSEEFKFDHNRKLVRTSKWLLPSHRRSPVKSRFLKNSTIDKGAEESEYVEVEEKIEEFIDMMKTKAKSNTNLPLSSLVKMPVIGLVGLVLDTFGIGKSRFLNEGTK